MSATSTVLAMSVRGDLALKRVGTALDGLGHELVPFYTDEFPASASIEFHAGRCEDVLLTSSGGHVALTEVSSVWLRRLDVGTTLPDSMDERYRTAARKESSAAVLGVLASYGGPVIDPLDTIEAASQKPRQLRAAAAVGLTTPPTLLTNSPQAARAFARENHDQVIAKPLKPLTVTGADGDLGMYASALAPEDLESLDSLRWCPLIFQAAVPKRLEIRATVVGSTVLAAAVDSQSSEHGQVDWRRGTAELAEAWEPHELPAHVADGLVRLVSGFGLHYSAADLILTPDGEYVFLESNPAGEWGWVEEATGLPISSHLAAALAGTRR